MRHPPPCARAPSRRDVLAACMLMPLAAGMPDVRGHLHVGTGRADLVPDGPVPLAGYGERFGRLGEGVADRCEATAISLLDAGTELNLVCVDLCGVSEELHADVARRAGTDPSTLLLAASHTHAGPGGYVNNAVFVPSVGWYRPEIFEFMAAQIADAVRRARRRRVTVSATYTRADVTGFNRNRRGEAGVDASMSLLRLSAGGRAVATVARSCAHPTILGPADLRMSAGWPGAFRRRIEAETGGACVMLQGAAGDAAPVVRRPAEGDAYARADAYGQALAEVALKRLAEAAPAPARLRVQATRVGAQRPDRLRLLLPTRRPWVHRVDLAGWHIVTVFGEPTYAVGRQVSAATDAAVVSCANDYAGYFVTASQAAAGGYEPSMAFYPQDLAGVLAGALDAAGD